MALVIGGHMGSGKSVLRKALYLHPDIVMTESFGNFRKVDVSYQQHVKALRLRWRYPSHYYPLSPVFAARYLGMIGFRSLQKRRVHACDIEAVLKRMFPHALVVGDVFSTYGRILDQRVNDPCLQHVIVYRDCRDVAAAMKKHLKGSWGVPPHKSKGERWMRKIETAEKVAHHWLHYIQAMERHRDKLYLIRYEDLASDPEAVLIPFGRWLGVDPEQFQYDFIHTNSVGDYRRFLSKEDVAEILAVAGPTMERLGYF